MFDCANNTDDLVFKLREKMCTWGELRGWAEGMRSYGEVLY